MRSRLYEGRVWHTRRDPDYTFEYRVWYLGLDLAETATVDEKLRLFSHNRANLSALWDRDYTAIEDQRAYSDANVELVSMPRFLGHVFNPVSFFLHRNAGGDIVHVAAEVHNTWGEKHVYSLHREATEASSEPFTAGIDKAFYVSPFIDMEGQYRFELREDTSGRLRIRIDEYDGEAWFFGAGIDVKPLPLTDGNLAKLMLKYPFVNLKTVLMIHWQGLRLWRRGEKFRANPSRRKKQRQTATGER